MAERFWLPSVHRSVFAKVVTSMLVMGASIVALVGGFLVFVNPNLNQAQGRLMFHNALVLFLLLLIVGVVFTANVVLKRALLPLRSLQQGVTRLSEGDLNVKLPSVAGDEFGALTEAFNMMVSRVNDMIRSRDQLLIDVSHELRSPLTRMNVAIALLPEEQRKGMAADVAEMEAMIAELLELERLRDGRGVRPVSQDLVPIFRETVQYFAERLPGVRLGSMPPSAVLDVDADRMRTVLKNLIENALKYSVADSGPVEISIVQDPATVTVRVSDEGLGIPDDDRPRLFEPFFRVDRSRSRKTGGYGLGLSICKRIVEAHGGTIAAENGQPRGATFVITLPKPVRSVRL